jgi:hypothetical protein
MLAMAMQLAPAISHAATGASPIAVTGYEIFQRGYQHAVWRNCLLFKNTSADPIVAARFVFAFRDAFGATIATETADASGTFGNGVTIDQNNCWDFNVGAIGAVGSVDVALVKARYADGTIWTNETAAPLYRQQYLGHPDRIHCGLLSYDWANAQDLTVCESTVQKWYAAHATIGDATNH